MRFLIALLAAATSLATGTAQAATVELREAVARVIVVPEDRADVRVEVIRPNAQLPLTISTEGDRTVVDGGLGHRLRDCNGLGEHARIRVRDVGVVTYEEMPQVVVHTPRAVSVAASGAIVGSIGRSASLEMHNSGCSNWTIADVAGEAQIHESGAGQVRMGQSARLDVRLSGAANIHATRVRGLDAQLSGAGNIKVDQIAGPLEARVSGVGQVRVQDGQSSLVRASVSGIGQVEFGGQAKDLDASISGLGSVRINEVTGSVSKSVSGGGHVSIGNRS
jgi:hypothetical protein